MAKIKRANDSDKEKEKVVINSEAFEDKKVKSEEVSGETEDVDNEEDETESEEEKEEAKDDLVKIRVKSKVESYVGNAFYRLYPGKEYLVPENVKSILRQAGYLEAIQCWRDVNGVNNKRY